jgi:phosphate transport system protein
MAFTNSHHTFKRFDTELDSLVSQVLEMARAAEQQVTRAVEAFRIGDVEIAREVVATDDIINRRDTDIDRSCIRLLSRRQPMSTDLRLIMSLNKAVQDLERIGDEAKNIANKTLAIQAREGALGPGIASDVHHLAQLVLRRFQTAQEVLAHLNAERAWQLVGREDAVDEVDEVDEVFQDNLRALSTHALDGGPAVANMIDVVLAIKALKRVSDHAENLAEYVIYVVEGRDVRHQR